MKNVLFFFVLLISTKNVWACDYRYQGRQIVYTPSRTVILKGEFQENQSFACNGESLAVIQENYELSRGLVTDRVLSIYVKGILAQQHKLTAVASNFISDKLYVTAYNNGFRVLSRFEFATLAEDKIEILYSADGMYSKATVLAQNPKGCTDFYYDSLNTQAFSISNGGTYSLISDMLRQEIDDEYLSMIPERARDGQKLSSKIFLNSFYCNQNALVGVFQVSIKHKDLNTTLDKFPTVFLNLRNKKITQKEHNGDFFKVYLRAYDNSILSYQQNSPIIKVFTLSGEPIGEIDPRSK